MDKSYYQFLAVAEHGSISAAAMALNLSQPTLTATIRKLEGQLGVPLLIRKSKGVELTEYGSCFASKRKRWPGVISVCLIKWQTSKYAVPRR